MEKLSVLLTIIGYISVFAVCTAHKQKVSHQISANRTLHPEQTSSDNGADPYDTEDRVIQSGDLLTPPELLPIAKRLITQVDTIKPGKGKGIVSSASSSEQLADLLFHRFFMTSDRVARLSKFDISGIDALQALALNGAGVQSNLKLVSVDGARCYVDRMAQEGVVDNNMCYFDGPEPRKSIYKLLTKPKNSTEDNNDTMSSLRPKREAVEMDPIVEFNNNLKKRRRLVLLAREKNRRLIRKGLINKTEENVEQLYVATSLPPSTATKKKGNLKGCTWKYICPNPGDLDSCKLQTSCPNTEKSRDIIEQENMLQKARRMLGISSVDEEVEKIFENRIVTFQALKRQRRAFEAEPRPSIQGISPIETLDQYITKILTRQENQKQTKNKKRQSDETTAPGLSDDDDLVEITLSDADNQKQEKSDDTNAHALSDDDKLVEITQKPRNAGSDSGNENNSPVSSVP